MEKSYFKEIDLSEHYREDILETRSCRTGEALSIRGEAEEIGENVKLSLGELSQSNAPEDVVRIRLAAKHLIEWLASIANKEYLDQSKEMSS